MILARGSAILLLLITLHSNADGKIYERCELARELRNFDMPEDEVPTWVCIAEHESNFDTGAMNFGSGDHGLFQISEIYWCSPPGYGCNSPCSKFRDEDIADDLQCIRRIHTEHTRISGDGFDAWVVYPLYCKGTTDDYIQDCFDENAPYNSTTIDNEISIDDEDGDGYSFPALPKQADGDGYRFPKLPTREQKKLPFSKTSINDFVPDVHESGQSQKAQYEFPKFPADKDSIHHSVFAPNKSKFEFPGSQDSIHPQKEPKFDFRKFPGSKGSIRDSVSAKERFFKTISDDIKSNPFLSGNISAKGSIYDSISVGEHLSKTVSNDLETNPFLNGKFSKLDIYDQSKSLLESNPFLSSHKQHDFPRLPASKHSIDEFVSVSIVPPQKSTSDNEIEVPRTAPETLFAQNPFLNPKSTGIPKAIAGNPFLTSTTARTTIEPQIFSTTFTVFKKPETASYKGTKASTFPLKTSSFTKPFSASTSQTTSKPLTSTTAQKTSKPSTTRSISTTTSKPFTTTISVHTSATTSQPSTTTIRKSSISLQPFTTTIKTPTSVQAVAITSKPSTTTSRTSTAKLFSTTLKPFTTTIRTPTSVYASAATLKPSTTTIRTSTAKFSSPTSKPSTTTIRKSNATFKPFTTTIRTPTSVYQAYAKFSAATSKPSTTTTRTSTAKLSSTTLKPFTTTIRTPTSVHAYVKFSDITSKPSATTIRTSTAKLSSLMSKLSTTTIRKSRATLKPFTTTIRTPTSVYQAYAKFSAATSEPPTITTRTSTAKLFSTTLKPFTTTSVHTSTSTAKPSTSTTTKSPSTYHSSYFTRTPSTSRKIQVPTIHKATSKSQLTSSTTTTADLAGASSTFIPHTLLARSTTPKPFPMFSTTTTRSTMASSARQVTFAPDSWFSWLFNSQTLPPFVAPPRPGSRPGNEGPPRPPPPLRPDVDFGTTRPRPPHLQPTRPAHQQPINNAPAGLVTTRRPPHQQPPAIGEGLVTTRRPLPRPPQLQPAAIDVEFVTTRRPLLRPPGPHSDVDRFTRRPLHPPRRHPGRFRNDEDYGSGYEEVPVDDQRVVYLRSKYGFRLFRV